jgi:DNA mismatch repair protein MSH5
MNIQRILCSMCANAASSHILQELTVSSFVPNDTTLVGGSGDNGTSRDGLHRYSSTERHAYTHEICASTLIMTGPNYSGKSVYLKQVAIIVYMAHIGSFVPAESARIGITDKILSRVATRESVSRIQSAFMIDLQQISLALSLATRRSLLIIDEFGKGTDSSDGAGLACAVFKHLLSLGTDSPKVLGITHFHGNRHHD